MREVVFALEFRGRGEAVEGSSTLRRARTVAPSQVLRTVIGEGGVQSAMEAVPGEAAVLESRVERHPDGSFVEDGRISYGRAGAISFVTIGRGTVGPSPVPGRLRGAVVWRVTGGDGGLAGAQGLITSNFSVDGDGQVVDHHVACLYLP
ncbi:MAG TPA: hypothetical protein VEL75_21080 [Candidatus Methylomirabilis sp.]|nr:hypothetical protein [Candidatus Methylomirabilis sp.]